MQHSAAFHLGIHFCISTGLGVPRIHRANITSGGKKKYFALQDTYKLYRGGQRVPLRGTTLALFLTCLSVCLPLCCLFVACLCPLSVFNLFVSVCPSIIHNVITNTLSFFLSLYTATPPREDYVQVDCVLKPGYKKCSEKELNKR